ncbi:hypothetical protein AMTR_s00072p00154660 [Amborella trichopoda]|uniref:Uncharacterized protein n=1 Tax=Amborella trichopoda TaxID=13333 RepID=W1NTH4_AMBTC|nr:hypothetical protein AMTR_s00072p00154660 [Amborella trichopoda]
MAQPILDILRSMKSYLDLALSVNTSRPQTFRLLPHFGRAFKAMDGLPIASAVPTSKFEPMKVILNSMQWARKLRTKRNQTTKTIVPIIKRLAAHPFTRVNSLRPARL